MATTTQVFDNNSQYRARIVAEVNGRSISGTLYVDKTAGTGYSAAGTFSYGFSIAGQSFNGSWGPYDFTDYTTKLLRNGTVNNLAAGTYNVNAYVNAHSTLGRAPASGIFGLSLTVITAPDAPAIPTATMVYPNEVALDWVAPDNNGAAIDYHQIQVAMNVSMTSGVAYATVNMPVTSAVLGATTYGQTRYYRVRAHNSQGYGSWSPIRSIYVPAAPSTPAAPTAVFVAPDKVDLDWAAPSSDRPITAYKVRYDDNASFSSPSEVNTGTSRSTLVSGLAIGKTWYFQVWAESSQGGSGWSPTRSVAVPNVPGKPNPPTVSEATPTSLRVSWTAPDNGGAAITGWDLRIQPAGESAYVVAQTDLSEVLTGLDPGKSYSFQVRAKNSQGVGTYSDVVSGSTLTGLYMSDGTTWHPVPFEVSNGVAWGTITWLVSTGSEWVYLE